MCFQIDLIHLMLQNVKLIMCCKGLRRWLCKKMCLRSKVCDSKLYYSDSRWTRHFQFPRQFNREQFHLLYGITRMVSTFNSDVWRCFDVDQQGWLFCICCQQDFHILCMRVYFWSIVPVKYMYLYTHRVLNHRMSYGCED